MSVVHLAIQLKNAPVQEMDSVSLYRELSATAASLLSQARVEKNGLYPRQHEGSWSVLQLWRCARHTFPASTWRGSLFQPFGYDGALCHTPPSKIYHEGSPSLYKYTYRPTKLPLHERQDLLDRLTAQCRHTAGCYILSYALGTPATRTWRLIDCVSFLSEFEKSGLLSYAKSRQPPLSNPV